MRKAQIIEFTPEAKMPRFIVTVAGMPECCARFDPNDDRFDYGDDPVDGAAVAAINYARALNSGTL